MRIYVASSWRNEIQDVVVTMLRAVGHEVYDFKHPKPGNDGFSWSAVDPAWKSWDGRQLRKALTHPTSAEGFGLDMRALEDCEACVLVLPSGRSAHLEAGWAAGAGRKVVVYIPEELPKQEPELMYLMTAGIVVTPHELIEALKPTTP